MLALALTLASNLLNASIDEKIIKKISRSQKIKSLAFKVEKSLFADNIKLSSSYDDMYYGQHIKGKLTQRLRYSIRKAKDEQANDKWHFPLTACLSIAYYMILPIWQSYKFTWVCG